MADNSAEISRLESILNAGSRSTSVDGLMVVHDLGEIRKRLAELKSTDDNTQRRRSIFNRINLSNAF